MGSADGEGQEKDDSLVHNSFEVNVYLVKANACVRSRVRARARDARPVDTRAKQSWGRAGACGLRADPVGCVSIHRSIYLSIYNSKLYVDLSSNLSIYIYIYLHTHAHVYIIYIYIHIHIYI